jgi:single-stranded-DNA-specific exonuclease
MLKAKYGWNVAVDGLVLDEDIFNHILKNRGIDDANRFFNMGKETLHDPFLLKDMNKAVSRILLAISADEPIIIFGDYDCDGITAISVLYRALKRLGANVDYDLPDRFSDGYGLNQKAVQKIIEKKYRLVITVDNGITCIEEVRNLQQAKIDCIITDHHEAKDILPEAYAIIHAKLSPLYPWKELAGVAVAYKLACAVCASEHDDLLDLVMIGTIADLMPLKDENQALVNLGLKQLAKTTHPGLKKLIQHSHLDQLNETAIAFKIAPKINSSGRLGKALDAVKLLVTDQDDEANLLIRDIEQNHSTRKDLTEEAFLTCERLMNQSDNVLVISSTNLHEGIIGICAQKMAEKYQKTTCVICFDEEGIGKGSCRAFGGDNILEMLDANVDLLIKYGGHSQAAGLTISESNLTLFKERMNLHSRLASQPILNIDMRLKLSTVTLPTVKTLEKYSFFTGTYLFENLSVRSKSIMAGKHTKLVVMDADRSFEAIIFNNTDYFYLLESGDIVDIVGGLVINQWKNKETLQIMIKDLRCQTFQVLDFRNHPKEVLDPRWLSNETVVINDYYLKNNDNYQIAGNTNINTVILGPFECLPALNKILSKDGLGHIYKTIQNVPTLETTHLASLIGSSEWIAEEAMMIFSELNLIERHGSVIKVLKTDKKRFLDESLTYRRLADTKKTYEFLMEGDLMAIKNQLMKHSEVKL